jgi:RimJ/RimL family protein N-acetyltransferase
MTATALANLSRTPITLGAEHVRLEPLSIAHVPDLFQVAQDDEVWRWLSIPPPSSLDEMRAWVSEALELQVRVGEQPFAVIDRATGAAIGSTRYLNVEAPHRGLEIGWTWYGRAYWRTAVNTECKYLLLRHAFESLGCIRVQSRTDLRNERSQQAIERLGAVREGVLRKHRIVTRDGYHRSSVCYSIIDDEWPTVKARLESMLNRT